MAGLLDQFFGGNPGQQGLLAGSMAMLNAGGPSRTPVSFGQALAQGWGAGQQAYQGAREFALKKQMRDFQMQEYISRLEEAKRKRDEQRRRQQSQAMAPQFGAVESVDQMLPQDLTALSVPPPGESAIQRFNNRAAKPRVSKLLNPMLPAKRLAPAIKRNMLVNKPGIGWPTR